MENNNLAEKLGDQYQALRGYMDTKALGPPELTQDVCFVAGAFLSGEDSPSRKETSADLAGGG